MVEMALWLVQENCSYQHFHFYFQHHHVHDDDIPMNCWLGPDELLRPLIVDEEI